MDLIINARQAGRKHALIEKQKIVIDDLPVNPSLRALLAAVVKQQVTAYNDKPLEKNLLPFLSREQITDQTGTGKVGFGSIYNENKADLAKAQETAMLAYEDGLFAVFADEEELQGLDRTFVLHPETVITFIRLTFLAGSFW
ncbi:hypothetical protein [Chitinophaga varians]|uniref:hypothetical protein n=1 Tax=Chitinophaga varians TaxID=2202339 RepID=UPI00165F181C|nr:hypothetical protein [Chitinophaga varians]MBC9909802.1 hypothetical protein [Chitinophaga varians]